MGQYWTWICKEKKEYFTGSFLGLGSKYLEQFYSGEFLYPMLQILMTDCSSLGDGGGDPNHCSAFSTDAYGRWYGKAAAIVGDYTKNEVNLDDFTCIDDIIGPAFIETLCLDNDREEMIALVKKLDPKNYIYIDEPRSNSALRKKIIELLEDEHNITAADFDESGDDEETGKKRPRATTA